MIDKVLAILCALSLFISQAFAQGMPMPGPGARDFRIQAPVNVGTATSSAVSSLPLTTTADIPAGSLIVVFVSISKSSTISVSSMSDTAGNSYSLARTSTWDLGTFITNEIWYKANATAMSSGGTITATLSATSGNDQSIQAAYVLNAAPSSPLDKVNSASSGGSCALPLPASGSTGTLTQANEIAFGFHGGYSNAATTPTTTPSSGFSLGNNYIVNTRNANHYDYQIVSATTALNNNPTIGGSGVTTYCAANIIATFKGL